MNTFVHMLKRASPLNKGEASIDVDGLVFSMAIESPDCVSEDGSLSSFMQFFSLEITASNHTANTLTAQRRLQKLFTVLEKQNALKPLLRHSFDNDTEYCTRVQTDVGIHTHGGVMLIENAKPLLRKALIVCINSGYLTQEQASGLFKFIDDVGVPASHEQNLIPNLEEARARIRKINPQATGGHLSP